MGKQIPMYQDKTKKKIKKKQYVIFLITIHNRVNAVIVIIVGIYIIIKFHN